MLSYTSCKNDVKIAGKPSCKLSATGAAEAGWEFNSSVSVVNDRSVSARNIEDCMSLSTDIDVTRATVATVSLT